MISLKYKLEKEDYLNYQLYCASTNERLKKRRRYLWLSYSLSLLTLALVQFMIDSDIFPFTFVLFFIVFILYPRFLRNRYYKHYKRSVEEMLKKMVEGESTITFKENMIEIFDNVGETKINHIAISEVVETSQHFYIKLQNNSSLIIPNNKVPELKKMENYLKELVKNMNKPYLDHSNWKWE